MSDGVSKHGNSLTSMQTHMGNFKKDYQKIDESIK